MCFYPHLSEAVIIDEIGSVSMDQGVEGKTVLPAVGQRTNELRVRRVFEQVRLSPAGGDMTTSGDRKLTENVNILQDSKCLN